MGSVTESLQLGTRYQLAGRLADAEKLYREVLAVDPRNADALHLMGTLATHVGKLDEAVRFIEDAIRSDPAQANFHVNLGEAYRRAGQLERAIACNQRAVELQPELAGAYANLGMLHELNGNPPKAAECFETLTRLQPNDPRARTLLGRALLACDRPGEAEAQFRMATRIVPQDGRAHYNLAAALQAQNRFEEAAASYRSALERRPNDADTHNNLGAVLHKLQSHQEAESHYRRAIEIDPDFAAAHNNLGTLLIECDRHDEAVSVLRRATELGPGDPAAHLALGQAFQQAGRLDDAIAAHRTTSQLNPQASAAFASMATCLQLLGRMDEAIANYQAAMRLDPDNSTHFGNYLYALNFLPEQDPAKLLAEHRAWAEKFADPLTAVSPPHTNERSADRRLRVGYVSAHFSSHAVNYFVEPILAAHDREKFEVYCYASVAHPDDVTERVRGHADHWRECLQQTDQEVCQRIRDDQIDILVDLAGHIGGNRLKVFAARPAPVQVSYIGYQNTTGMQAIDYRLTDEYSDPPGTTDPFYTEELVRLPRSFFCYRPSDDAPPVTPPPVLERGYVTFGSFNNFAKVTRRVLVTWATLLKQVPGSRLVLLTGLSDELCRYVAGIFTEQGVDPARIDHQLHRRRTAYLELISRVDISLDPFPFNGHTTTCDTLWQGVPVVAMAGDVYASRFGCSGLVTLGLEDLIARTPDEYVDIAARLAGDVERLKSLRQTMRERMASSPLLDFAGFTRNLEAAYRQMWKRWCDQQTS